MAIAPHTNFDKMNGVIPGEGLTNPPGAMPCQNPPQFVHLDDLLEMVWNKLNQPDMTVQVYGLLKSGVPAEAIARTILFGAFSQGVCTPNLAMLGLKTVVRQIAALGKFLGLKNIKIKNHRPEDVKQLAEIQKVINQFGSVDEESNEHDDISGETPATQSPFSGLGL